MMCCGSQSLCISGLRCKTFPNRPTGFSAVDGRGGGGATEKSQLLARPVSASLAPELPQALREEVPLSYLNT
jgi:hypothetical protein